MVCLEHGSWRFVRRYLFSDILYHCCLLIHELVLRSFNVTPNLPIPSYPSDYFLAEASAFLSRRSPSPLHTSLQAVHNGISKIMGRMFMFLSTSRTPLNVSCSSYHLIVLPIDSLLKTLQNLLLTFFCVSHILGFAKAQYFSYLHSSLFL